MSLGDGINALAEPKNANGGIRGRMSKEGLKSSAVVDPPAMDSTLLESPALSSAHEVVLVPSAREHEHTVVAATALLNAVAEPGDGLVVRASRPTEELTPQRQVVVVTPSTARGLSHASALISTWRPALTQPGLLIMRDAPLPPPQVVVQRTRALAERVQISVEIPYLYRLRLVDDLADALQSKGRDVSRTRRRLRDIRRRLYTATFLAAGGGPGEPVRPLELAAPTPSTSVPTAV